MSHFSGNRYVFIKKMDEYFFRINSAKHNPEEPHYFGKYFKVLGGYTSGGAGYVISREALRKLEDVVANEKSPRCRTNDKNGNEDVNIG